MGFAYTASGPLVRSSYKAGKSKTFTPFLILPVHLNFDQLMLKVAKAKKEKCILQHCQ